MVKTGIVLVLLAGWWVSMQPLIDRFIPVSYFVTNNREDNVPTITVIDGDLEFGISGQPEKGSPRVYPDWLARRQFYDFRKIWIYRNNAEGEPICAFGTINPKEPFRNRKGTFWPGPPRAGEAVSLSGSFSLDQWTNFTLSKQNPDNNYECNIVAGTYVVVTEYAILLFGGRYFKRFTLTSNPFTIKGTSLTFYLPNEGPR